MWLTFVNWARLLEYGQTLAIHFDREFMHLPSQNLLVHVIEKFAPTIWWIDDFSCRFNWKN